LSKIADVQSRSVRVGNLPPGTQEGLLQQTFEKLASVKRVEVFADLHEAIVEVETAAVRDLRDCHAANADTMMQEAGKLHLRREPIIFNGNKLVLSEESKERGSKSLPSAPPSKTTGMFVPRTTGSRPRAGLGRSRKPVMSTAAAGSAASSTKPTPKSQDDFRRLLG
jgi:hypothetical protein